MIFDTHSHYDDEAFNADRFTLLESMKENGIGTIVSIGCDDITSQNAQALSEKYPFVYFTAIMPKSLSAVLRKTKKWWQ